MNAFQVSLATDNDVELLVQHRVNMWLAIRPDLKPRTDKMMGVTRIWIKKMLSENRLIGFIAKDAKTSAAAGSGCIWLSEEQPRFIETQPYSPLLISMYTEELYRRKGVASLIVQEAIDWSRAHGYNMICLQASEMGASVYEHFGFKRTSEMRLILVTKPQ